MPIALPNGTRLLRKESADGLPVIIEELGGQQESLVLAGRDRPDKGIEFETKLRKSMEYNPGSDTATTHIMGLSFEPIVLRGRFDDVFDLVPVWGSFSTSPTNPIIGGSRLKAHFIQNLHARKGRCRMYWGNNWVVEGYIDSVKTVDIRHQVIGYEIVFQPDQPYNDQEADDPLLTESQKKISGLLDDVALVASGLEDLFRVFYKVNRQFVFNGAPIELPGDLPGGL